MTTLVVPVVVALAVSLVCGTVSFLINSAKSETKIEKLEKDLEYIRQRQDYLIDKLIPPAK